jgi:lipopolysaccharide/colanic/teichoic acid biosynthesis glycosyltransferase
MNDNKALIRKLNWQRKSDLVTLAIWSPVLIPLTGIVLAVCYANCGVAIYVQSRVGYLGKEFNLVKAKTMQDIDKLDPSGDLKASYEKLSTDEKASFDSDFRVNKVSRFLRKFRLDELPQIWNIIWGDMSFVGPRPHKPEDSINNDYTERQQVRAGLTGPGKLIGLNGVSHDQEGCEDIKYIHTVLQKTIVELQIQRIKIYFQTAGALVKHRHSPDAYAPHQHCTKLGTRSLDC